MERISQTKVSRLRGGLSPWQLSRVMEFMQSKTCERVTLNDLASYAGLSISHFCRQFRKSVGVTPQRCMVKLRIEKSLELLANPKLSILEVALASGFENQQHFATVFRRVAGMTPSTYRSLL
jgi:AraC family transcriptional regulator